MNAPPSTVAAERHRHVVGVGAVRRGVPEPQRRLHRAGPVHQQDPPRGPAPARRAAARAGRGSPGGAGERGRRQRGEVDPVQVAGDEQRAGRGRTRRAWNADHVVDRHRRPPRSGSPCSGRPCRTSAPNRSARSAASARGPGLRPVHPQRGRPRRRGPGRRRPGRDAGVRTASASSATAAGSRSTGTCTLTWNESQSTDDGQLGAQPLQRERVRRRQSRSRVPSSSALATTPASALAAERLATGAGVEQQRRDGQVAARAGARRRPCRRRRPAGRRRERGTGAAAPGPGRSATSVMPRPPRARRSSVTRSSGRSTAAAASATSSAVTASQPGSRSPAVRGSPNWVAYRLSRSARPSTVDTLPPPRRWSAAPWRAPARRR